MTGYIKDCLLSSIPFLMHIYNHKSTEIKYFFAIKHAFLSVKTAKFAGKDLFISLVFYFHILWKIFRPLSKDSRSSGTIRD